MSDDITTPVRRMNPSPFIAPQTSFESFPTLSRLDANRVVDTAITTLESFTSTTLGDTDAIAALASMLRSVEEHPGTIPVHVADAVTAVRRYAGLPDSGPTSTARRFLLRRGLLTDPAHCPCSAHVPWHRHI